MISFHINDDLVNIFKLDIINFSSNFWFFVWRISAITFIFISGIWISLAKEKYKKDFWKKYFSKAVTLFFISLLISLVTYLIMPNMYISFGIIHFFSISFFLMIIFTRFSYLNLFIGIAVILIGLFKLPYVSNNIFSLFWFHTMQFQTLDYYPLIPNFGLILIWYTLWKYFIEKNLMQKYIWWKINSSIWNFLEYCGKNSLTIYIIHQPIIIGLIGIFLNIT